MQIYFFTVDLQIQIQYDRKNTKWTVPVIFSILLRYCGFLRTFSFQIFWLDTDLSSISSATGVGFLHFSESPSPFCSICSGATLKKLKRIDFFNWLRKFLKKFFKDVALFIYFQEIIVVLLIWQNRLQFAVFIKTFHCINRFLLLVKDKQNVYHLLIRTRLSVWIYIHDFDF